MNICDSGEAKINPDKEILCSYAKLVLFTGLGFLLEGVQKVVLPWIYVLLYLLLKVTYTIPKGCHILKMIFHIYSPGMKSSCAAFKSQQGDQCLLCEMFSFTIMMKTSWCW